MSAHFQKSLSCACHISLPPRLLKEVNPLANSLELCLSHISLPPQLLKEVNPLANSLPETLGKA